MFSLADCMNDQRIDEVNALVRGFPGGSVVKSPLANAGDVGSIPGSGRSPGEGNGNPLQCSGLENSMDCIVFPTLTLTWFPIPATFKNVEVAVLCMIF